MLGFVDTAVIGHLPSPAYLAGAALGSLLITLLFWLLGFLRMSTTALVAQAFGKRDLLQQVSVIAQGLTWIAILSVLIIGFQSQIFQLLLFLIDKVQMEAALTIARQYFDIRIWITPFALTSLVLTGFLIGRGETKVVLYGVLACNLINLLADLLFVPVLGYGIEGVAYASVLAEGSLFFYYLKKVSLKINGLSLFRWSLFKLEKSLFSLNRDIFLRSFLLQLCLSFMTIYATRFGPIEVAVNAILLQFFLFISFSLDGIAFSLESLVGQTQGNKQTKKLKIYIRTGLILSSLFALIYSLLYMLLSPAIVSMLTNIEVIKLAMSSYTPWVILFPLVSYLSFIMDGIYIGLAWSKAMLATMLFAAIVFFSVVLLTMALNNHGLWLAFCCFMFARGLSQAWFLKKSLY